MCHPDGLRCQGAASAAAAPPVRVHQYNFNTITSTLLFQHFYISTIVSQHTFVSSSSCTFSMQCDSVGLFSNPTELHLDFGCLDVWLCMFGLRHETPRLFGGRNQGWKGVGGKEGGFMPEFEEHALCPTAIELRLLALEHLEVALLPKVVAVVGRPLLKCRWH